MARRLDLSDPKWAVDYTTKAGVTHGFEYRSEEKARTAAKGYARQKGITQVILTERNDDGKVIKTTNVKG